MLDIDAATVAAVLEDHRTAPASEQLRAGLAVVEAVTVRPAEPMAALVASARACGLSNRAVEDAANVAFHFNLINRAADAFDFPMPTPRALPKIARLLDGAKRLAGGSPPSPTWTRRPDGVIRPVEVARGYQRFVSVPATSSAEDRRAAEAYAAHLRGAARTGSPPVALEKYLKKVATAAYKVVDEDVDGLRAAGLTDRAIYELTMVAAFGASVVGLETLFQALYGAG